MDFKTSTFMYLLGGAVVVFVLAQSLFFLIRAWKQGKKIGLAESTMKKTVVSSALFSVAPAIAILATVLTLSGALGIVLPWIRLSVIGNITYEVPAAQSALDALGLTGGLSREVTDKTAFSAAAWVMTLGSVMPLVILPFAVKFIQKKIGSVVHNNGGWANAMRNAAFSGLLSAFIGRAMLGCGDPDVLGVGKMKHKKSRRDPDASEHSELPLAGQAPLPASVRTEDVPSEQGGAACQSSPLACGPSQASEAKSDSPRTSACVPTEETPAALRAPSQEE